MNRKVLKDLFCMLSICLIGFVIGFVLKDFFNVKVNGSKKSNSQTEDVKIKNESEFFNDELYDCTYNEKTGLYSYTIKDSKTRSIDNQYCEKKDILDVTEAMLESKYELVNVDDSTYNVAYKEYKDGYPTGASASFALDEEGIVIATFFSKGSVYKIDETEMISYEEAFEIGKKATLEKYGNDTIIDGVYSDYEYEIMYRPDLGVMCYKVESVEGHMNGDFKTDINQVEFWFFVSIDGEVVEIASTLMY